MATITGGTGAAVITTDGTGDAAITNGTIIGAITVTTIITDRPSLQFAFAVPLPGRYANCSGTNGSRPHGAAGSAVVRSDGAQPNPISTAIRIRSE